MKSSTAHKVITTFLVLFSITAAIIAQSTTRNRQIRELDPVTASQIDDDDAVFFGVDKTDVPNSFRLSLAELKKTQPQARNVKQYGAEGDTVTEDTAAIQAAVDATPSGGTLFFPEGTYRMAGIDIVRPITIYGPGVCLIDANEYGFDINLDALWGNAKQLTAISTVSTSGGTLPQVSLCTATDHGFVVGDVIKIYSDRGMGITSNDWYAEIFRVTKVVDTDNFWVNRVLLANFTDIGSGHAVYARKMPEGRVDLDLNFDVVAGSEDYDRNDPESNHGPLVKLTGAVDPIVYIAALKSYGTVFEGRSIYKGIVNVSAADVDVPRAAGNTANVDSKVVYLTGGCNGTKVTISSSGGIYGFYGSVFAGAAFDTSITSMVNSGVLQNILVHDSYIENAAHTSYYNGGGNRSTHFDNCVSKDVASLDSSVLNDASNGFGFKDGSDGTRYTGCFVDGARTGIDTDNGAFWTDIAMTITDFRCTNCSYAGLFLQTQGLPSVINGFECSSPCTAIRLSTGRYHVRNVTVTNLTDYNASPFVFDGGSTSTWDNITILGGADAEPPFQIDGTTYVILRNIWMDRAIDEDPVALLTVSGTATVDVDTVHFTGEPYPDGDGYDPAAFPPQGLIATASTGTVTLISDSFRSAGRRHEFGTAAPGTQAHRQGDIVWNTNPTAGGTMGWICTVAGTPGTWKTFGAITP